MALYTELEQPMRLLELTQLFESNTPPEGINDGVLMWYEEVAVKIIKEHGEEGLDYLLSSMSKWDEKRLSGVLLSLCFLPPDTLNRKRAMLMDLLLSHLHDSRELIVAEAIGTLRYFDGEDILAHVLPFVSHPSPYVQRAALHFLGKCHFDIAKPFLFAALESPSYIIRAVAIDEFDEALYVDALPKIRELLSDSHPHVRQAAETAVADLEEERKRIRGNE